MRRVWTDGACKGNPGPGGWAWVDPEGGWARGGEDPSTNQRMEIRAAFEAVRANPGPLTVVSDSTYVVNCFRDRWWEGWLRRDWKNSQRKPVSNRDLWEPFIELCRERGDVHFEWVKGHAGDRWNDVADRLAVAAAADQCDRSGDGAPDADDLTAEDRPTGAARDVMASVGAGSAAALAQSGRDRRLPEGRLLGVFGAKPTELGGYDENPTAERVGRRLREILEAKATMHPDLVVVSGLRLGAEMLGAQAARDAGIPLVAVLPFPDPDRPWPAASRRRFADLRAGASATLTLERATPDTNAKIGAALRRRDAWLARNLDEAVVVWDGAEPFVGKLVASLRDRLGDDVWHEPIP